MDVFTFSTKKPCLHYEEALTSGDAGEKLLVGFKGTGQWS